MNAGFEDVRVLDDLLEDDEGDDPAALCERFFAARKGNADAIADLALDNFVEMRDRVADPRFLLRKKIEAKISALYGEAYLPLYSMVTFSHLPYAEAQRRGREQDALMAEVMALPHIETRWESPEVEALVRARLGEPPA
jgi:kynurenine 3-monooxygenase